MTLEEVIEAKAAGQQVVYQEEPVTILKANAQLIYVTKGGAMAPIAVTAEQLSAL